MGCHQQYGHHQKVYRMCIILVQVPSPLSILLRRYGWLKFTHIYVFHNYSRLQSWITPNLYGLSPTMWRSSQSTQKGLHFDASSVTIAQSDRKIWAPKLELTFKFPKSCQLSKLCSSKTNGGVTPTNAHHWNQLSFYSHPTQVRAS